MHAPTFQGRGGQLSLPFRLRLVIFAFSENAICIGTFRIVISVNQHKMRHVIEAIRKFLHVWRQRVTRINE
jgi:hypothetical protein